MLTPKQRFAVTSLKALLEREYAWEKQNYSVDKRIANLVSEMGFAVADQQNGSSKFHRLIKQTDKHLVVITYEIRKRLICPPEWKNDPESVKKM